MKGFKGDPVFYLILAIGLGFWLWLAIVFAHSANGW